MRTFAIYVTAGWILGFLLVAALSLFGLISVR